MKKILLILILPIMITINIFSEHIFLFSRTTFAVSQFWEKNVAIDDSGNVTDARRVFSNFLTGSLGIGMEMVIWDNGRKRGSRIYVKTGMDVLFSGPTNFGVISGESASGTLKKKSLNGGAFYSGFDLDLFFGGTFPMMDLFWGIGSVFYFTFAGYAPKVGIDNFNVNERFAFYAAPALILGYDIFLPNTNYKITPQIRTGITCIPLIPDDLVGGMDKYNSDKTEMYSGFYVDISVAFSFYSAQWKK